MILRIRPVKGIWKPDDYSYQLQRAESYSHYKRHIAIVIVASMILYVVSGFLGIGTDSISKELVNNSSETLSAKRQLFLIGSLMSGVIVSCVFLFFSSAFYWSFIHIEFRKVVIVQMSVFTVFLLEKALEIPVYIFLDVSDQSNIFSLGILGQYITDNQFIIQFLSQVTIFRIGMMILSYNLLKEQEEISLKKLLIATLLLFTFYWICSGVLSYIKVGIFL